MSNYISKAINPKTGKEEEATFLDNYFGHREYSVQFSDGKVYREDKIKIVETSPYQKIIPKWGLEKVEIIRSGVLDDRFSGYELQKDGIAICKFGLDSLRELKEFFADLIIENI